MIKPLKSIVSNKTKNNNCCCCIVFNKLQVKAHYDNKTNKLSLILRSESKL